MYKEEIEVVVREEVELLNADLLIGKPAQSEFEIFIQTNSTVPKFAENQVATEADIEQALKLNSK